MSGLTEQEYQVVLEVLRDRAAWPDEKAELLTSAIRKIENEGESDWIAVSEGLPLSSEPVVVRTPGGDIRLLRYHDNLWWLPDDSMYVYFTPTYWAEASI